MARSHTPRGRHAQRRRHPRSQRADSPIPALVASAGAVIVVVGAFLPWYATNLGEPAEVGRASGWQATGIGKAVVALAIIWLICAALAAADDVGSVRLDARTLEGFGYLVVLCAVLVAVGVGYRIGRPPGATPDFLSREIGLPITAVGALLGLFGGVALASRRDTRPKRVTRYLTNDQKPTAR